MPHVMQGVHALVAKNEALPIAEMQRAFPDPNLESPSQNQLTAHLRLLHNSSKKSSPRYLKSLLERASKTKDASLREQAKNAMLSKGDLAPLAKRAKLKDSTDGIQGSSTTSGGMGPIQGFSVTIVENTPNNTAKPLAAVSTRSQCTPSSTHSPRPSVDYRYEKYIRQPSVYLHS
jgi:hypothetical protein